MQDTKSITFPELLDTARNYETRKADFAAKAGPGQPSYTFGFNGKCELTAIDQNDISITPMKVGEGAWGQIGGRLGPATQPGFGHALPKNWLNLWANDAAFQPHLAAMLNIHMSRYAGNAFVRTFDGEVRAFLTERYSAVSNLEVLDTANAAVSAFYEAGRITRDTSVERLVRPFLSPDALDLQFVMPNILRPPGEDSDYGLGFAIRNNEVGNGGIGIQSLLWRGKCTNSIRTSSVVFQHRGLPEYIKQSMALSLANAVKLAGETLRNFMLARQQPMPNLFDVISKMASDENWSTPFADAVRTGAEGQLSLYGLVNGLTFAAHDVFSEQPETRAEWETYAGTVLTKQLALPSLN